MASAAPVRRWNGSLMPSTAPVGLNLCTAPGPIECNGIVWHIQGFCCRASALASSGIPWPNCCGPAGGIE